MDNLLPLGERYDVSSDGFRESVLPHLLWEGKKTECVPSTPSEIVHLLPSIGKDKALRRPNEPSTPRVVEPGLPLPAPVDRNLLGLYDPSFDPSPIGVEKRGITQPVQIKRPAPCADWVEATFGKGTRPSIRSGQEATGGSIVTILNGYIDQGSSTVEDKEEVPCSNASTAGKSMTLDVFVKRNSRRIEHVAIYPKEMFRRNLKLNSSMHAHQEDAADYFEVSETIEEKDALRGLTVLLANAAHWPIQTDDSLSETRNIGQPFRTLLDVAAQEDGADSGQDPHAETNKLPSNSIDVLFRHRNGSVGPPPSAFRVQFEPGPLGMELEQDPSGKGLVQVRRILQAGQAEDDGRPSAGTLVVAVGDWDTSIDGISHTSNSDYHGRATDPEDGRVGSLSSLDTLANSEGQITTTLVRTLDDFEAAAHRRGRDSLFCVWMVDRYAPEAIKALGEPQATGEAGNDVYPTRTSTGYREKAVLNKRGRNPNKIERGTPDVDDMWGGHRNLESWFLSAQRSQQRSPCPDRWSSGTLTSSGSLGSSSLEVKPGVKPEVRGKEQPPTWGLGSVPATENNSLALLESMGMPGWETGYSGKEGVQGNSDQGERSNSLPEGVIKDEFALIPMGILKNGTEDVESKPKAGGMVMAAESLAEYVGGKRPNQDEKCKRGDTGENMDDKSSKRFGHERWDFETGAGMFEDEDQMLAGRRVPRGDVLFEALKNKGMLRPMGLQASVSDEKSIFVWFCNHNSYMIMQVAWVDYGGNLVLRRSLSPGECYLELSFSSHPWVICPINPGETDDAYHTTSDLDFPVEQSHKSDRVGNGGSCDSCYRQKCGGSCIVVRVGDAMATSRTSGSLIWNPSTSSISFMLQAKIGTRGMGDRSRVSPRSSGDLSEPGKGNTRNKHGQGNRVSCDAFAAARRARLRRAKEEILEQMRAWRTYPSGVDLSPEEGLGVGVPNLKFVMIGSGNIAG